MKHLKLTYYLLATIIILGCLGSCSVEDDTTNIPTAEKNEIAASFSIQLNTGSVNASRVVAPTTDGTASENVINSIILFIIDQTTGNITKANANILSDTNNKQAIASLRISKGNKTIFAGINLSETQANLFVSNYQNGNSIGTIGNISEVTTTNSFAMFGQATTKGGNNNIEIIEGIYDYNIKANVSRIVAKIIVACELSNAQKDLLNVNNGYVKRTDVKYIINTTNQKFYFAGNADKADPNYNLSDWLDNNGNPISGKDLTKEFIYNTNNVFTNGNIAEVHTDDVKTYMNGYYCLENTVNNNINLTSVDAAQKVATYVRIGYKFTPNRLYNNGNVNIYTYEQALEIMNSTEGTFYTYNKAPKADKNICYVTLDDIKAHYNLQNLAPEDYTKFQNGHIERNCFVNSVDFTNGASVVRNNYYILNLKSISLPIDNNSIEINTESVGWTLKGNTTVDFEPNM